MTTSTITSKGRAEALVVLAAQLSEPLKSKALREALDAVRRIKNIQSRAKALLALIPQLSEPLKGEALREALTTAMKLAERDWRGNRLRQEALTRLVPYLVDLPPSDLLDLWQDFLRIHAARTRRDLLADLHAMVPVIETLGGGEAVEETACTLRQVGLWWP